MLMQKKIAILHPKATIKGWAIKMLFEIAQTFALSDNEIKFFVLELDRENCFPELNSTFDIRNYDSKGYKKIFAYLMMAFSIRKYDIIIAWNSPMHFVAALSKIFNPKAKIYWYLQNIPVYYLDQNKWIITTIKKYLEKLVIPFLTRIVTNSTFIKEEAEKDFWKTTQILYPFIDTDFFANDHAVLEENQTLFCYSRLSKWKNVELAIDAFIELQKKYPWLKLVIWWDWEEKEMLMEKAQFYENIQFLWEITQAEARLQFERCTVFLFTSLIDAFWLTILEAMSMEKAIVAMAIWWALELIWNWENWYLWKNKEEFIAYIDELLSDENKRKEMWEKWRSWALEHFSFKQFEERVFSVFK